MKRRYTRAERLEYGEFYTHFIHKVFPQLLKRIYRVTGSMDCTDGMRFQLMIRQGAELFTEG